MACLLPGHHGAESPGAHPGSSSWSCGTLMNSLQLFEPPCVPLEWGSCKRSHRVGKARMFAMILTAEGCPHAPNRAELHFPRDPLRSVLSRAPSHACGNKVWRATVAYWW